MKRRIIAFSLAVMLAAIGFVVIEAKESNTTENISQGNIDTYGAPNAKNNIVEDFANDQLGVATDIYGVVSDLSEIGGEVIGNVGGDLGIGESGGIGGIIGDVGDIIGGILGGEGGSGSLGGNTGGTYAPQDTTGEYISIIPAATDYYTLPDPNLTSSTEAVNVGETVDFGSNINPYTKPVGELKGGDTGDGVKWIQWIFIYTRYGLRDDGITGVFDEDTMAVVKKFQNEYGLVADGVVGEEEINMLEYFYLQTINPDIVTYAPISSSNSAPTTKFNAKSEDDNSLAIIIALVSAVWILAFVFVIVLKMAKNKSNRNKPDAPKEELKENSTTDNTIDNKTDNKSDNQ